MKYDEFVKMCKGSARRHPPRHIESEIQKSIVVWFRAHYPRYIIAAIPNGGYRNAREAAIMKSEGVLAGFSDLIVIAQGKILFVEIKTAKGKQSERQKYFQKSVEALGFPYAVCRSLADFVSVFGKWYKENYKV